MPQKPEPPAVTQLGHAHVLHGELADQVLEAVKDPLRDLVIDTSADHVQDTRTEPEPSLPSSFDLAHTFSLAPPAEPFMSQDQQESMVLFAPSRALQQSECCLTSPDLEPLPQSTLVPQVSEASLTTSVDVEPLTPALTCNSEPMVVTSCNHDDPSELPPIVEPLSDQLQSIPPIDGQESVPMQSPPVDLQQSLHTAVFTHQADHQPVFATPLSLQPVPSLLPQLDPQAVSPFAPPIVAQQPVPESSLTPTVETTPKIDLVPPVNGEPEPELELSAVPLDEEESGNVALAADRPEEEAALEEVPSPCLP